MKRNASNNHTLTGALIPKHLTQLHILPQVIKLHKSAHTCAPSVLCERTSLEKEENLHLCDYCIKTRPFSWKMLSGSCFYHEIKVVMWVFISFKMLRKRRVSMQKQKLLIHFYKTGGGLRKMSTEGCASSSDASRSLRLITDAFLAPWQPVRGERKEWGGGGAGGGTDWRTGKEKEEMEKGEKMSNLVHWKWSWQET